ncbi:MAG: hypothetical protein Q9224_001235 [Gallowayella concinna]
MLLLNTVIPFKSAFGSCFPNEALRDVPSRVDVAKEKGETLTVPFSWAGEERRERSAPASGTFICFILASSSLLYSLAKSIATMASVPLHCHICPKRPDFSDISHLLTHVGSKGHLSHYFKAQVRARQDSSIRQQIEIYDRWYEENQIEKLLSQRMVLKDSKKPNGITSVTNREPSAPAKSTKTSKKRNAIKTSQLPATARPEAVIDPRLSQRSPAGDLDQCQPSHLSSSPGFDLVSMHPAPMPPLRTFHTPRSRPAEVVRAEPKQSATPSQIAPVAEKHKAASDTESDPESAAERSCMNFTYSEPPTTEAFHSTIEPVEGSSAPHPKKRGRPRRVQSYLDAGEMEDVGIPRTPELKGVCYPGMSLFDAASAEAQKKRNQRKNDTILAQIQQESLEVECNEYIYWPDGSLKMCRFITGDVQSSPYKDDTPPPPPAKRRRGRRPKSPIESINHKRLKAAEELHATDNQAAYSARYRTSLTDLPDLMKSPTVYAPMSPPFGNPSLNTKEGNEEWFLNKGESVARSHRLFPVFLDQKTAVPNPTGDPVKSHPNPLRPLMNQHNPGPTDDAYMEWLMSTEYSSTAQQQTSTISDRFPSRFPNHRAGVSGRPILGAPQSQSNGKPGNKRMYNLPMDESKERRVHDPKTMESICPQRLETGLMLSTSHAVSTVRSGKENVPPRENGNQAGGSMTQEDNARQSQTYFMTKGNQAPQISAMLPPEMAFAGMRTPPVYRASLNPLNPNAHCRQSLPYSSNYTPFRSAQAATHPFYSSFATGFGQDPMIKSDGEVDLKTGSFVV